MTKLEKALLEFDEKMKACYEDIGGRPQAGKMEVWDFIMEQDLNYLEGSVIKYVCRAGKDETSDYLTDMRKAKVYLDKIIEICGE